MNLRVIGDTLLVPELLPWFCWTILLNRSFGES